MGKTKEIKLTAKQKLFKDAILQGKNQTEAASIANYSNKSKNYLARVGSENVRKCNIKSEIDHIQAKISGKLEITLEEIANNARYLIELGREKKNGADIAAGNKQLGEMKGAFKQVLVETVVKPEVVMFTDVMDKDKE